MVAHRLETTVQYCDTIMVLDHGELKAMDTPVSLLCEDPSDETITKKSIFAEMVQVLESSTQ